MGSLSDYELAALGAHTRIIAGLCGELQRMRDELEKERARANSLEHAVARALAPAPRAKKRSKR